MHKSRNIKWNKSGNVAIASGVLEIIPANKIEHLLCWFEATFKLVWFMYIINYFFSTNIWRDFYLFTQTPILRILKSLFFKLGIFSFKPTTMNFIRANCERIFFWIRCGTNIGHHRAFAQLVWGVFFLFLSQVLFYYTNNVKMSSNKCFRMTISLPNNFSPDVCLQTKERFFAEHFTACQFIYQKFHIGEFLI